MSENAPRSLESWLHEAYAIPRPDCPPRQLLHQLALQDLDLEQRKHLQEHLNGCPECAAEYDMAALFESSSADDLDASEVAGIVASLERESPVHTADGRPHAGRQNQGRDRAHRWFAWPRALPGWQLAAAAALVVVMIVATWPRPPALPSAHETTLRGGTVRTISPQGDVEMYPTQLTWQPHPEATTYSVRLLTVDDTVLWEGVVADSEIDLPATVGEMLQPLVRYAWTVAALNETGALVAASEPQSFRIRPVDHPAPPQPR